MPELPKWHLIEHLLRAERWLFRKETFLNFWRITSAFVLTATYLPISIVAILCTPHKWSARNRGLTGWAVGQYVWTGAILWCTGCTVRVEGYLPDWMGSYVFAPNHTGIFDHIIMGHSVNRGHFVYKSDLRWYPFLGQILMLLGQIPINRKNRDSGSVQIAFCDRTNAQVPPWGNGRGIWTTHLSKRNDPRAAYAGSTKIDKENAQEAERADIGLRVLFLSPNPVC